VMTSRHQRDLTVLVTGGAFTVGELARAALVEGSRQAVEKTTASANGTVAAIFDSTTTINSDNPDPSAAGQAVTVNFTVAPVAPSKERVRASRTTRPARSAQATRELARQATRRNWKFWERQRL